MKIGIITWFQHENFGTALQAIALQAYLRNNGYNVELINYKLPTQNITRPKRSFYDTAGAAINKLDHIVHKDDYARKSAKYKSFIADNCALSKVANDEASYISICNQYDVLIFGSDQIWNPNWHHPFYFANFKEINSKRVSYAPSFGVSKIDNKDKERLAKAINRFNALSVREKTGISIVKKITDKEPSLVVDPTLLLDKKIWDNYKSQNRQKGKYILCYLLTDNKKHWRAIKRFSKKEKLPIVVLPHNGYSTIQSKHTMRDSGPSDFISLVDNAEYVITDSYHAIIFSLIYKKKLILFERHDPLKKGAENSRIHDFLKLIDSSNILIPYNSNSINDNKICDLSGKIKKLDDIIDYSKQYLKRTLE